MDKDTKQRMLIGDTAELIMMMANIAVQAKDGDNHALVQALSAALSMTVASSIGPGNDVDMVADKAGLIVAQEIKRLSKGVTLNRKVDLMQATVRMAKGLPLAEEEEAALYAMDIIDKDGKLTELGRQGAEIAQERNK